MSLAAGTRYGHSFAALIRDVQKDDVVRGSAMMKKALACTMLLGAVFSLRAAADDTGLKFKRGIGVIPVSSVTCKPTIESSAKRTTITSPVALRRRQLVDPQIEYVVKADVRQDW
jgi:hypothetical protein